jgi:hypothetical protein
MLCGFLGGVFSLAAEPEPPAVQQVIVVFKTHFDIGYTDMAVNIVQKYRTTMIDQALEVVDRNRDLPAEQQFAWTIPGWPMHKILQDWPGQTPERKRRVMDAFKTGRFVVHALPFSTHTETLEPEDLVRGMGFASQVCRDAGLELPRDAKMTDVPEHTWVLPTMLKAAGVDFLHIGCNGGSAPMRVPPLFWWEGPDGSRLLTMYATQYGTQLVPPKDWKHKTWLALIHTGDNHGPPRPEEVKKLLDEAAKKLPGVKVKIGRLSDFADAIVAEKAEIPVVRGDMPDTWIHGPMSDPQGMSLARNTRPKIAMAEGLGSLLRAWGVAAEPAAPAVAGAYEQSLLYGEHTWGASIGWIGNKIPYGAEFLQAREAGKLKRSEDSWEEHSDYARTAAKLAGPVLAGEIKALAQAVGADGPRIVVYNPLPWRRDGLVSVADENRGFACVKPADGGDVITVQWSAASGMFMARDIPAMGYRAYSPVKGEAGAVPKLADAAGGVIENAQWRVKIDANAGAIVSLIHKESGHELVEPGQAGLGQHLYERFDAKNIADFMNAYCRPESMGWAANDFGKKGIPMAGATHESRSPEFAAEIKAEEGPCSGRLSMGGRLRMAEGKTCDVTTAVQLYRDLPYVDIDMTMKDKPLESWPEAMWMALPLNVPNPKFLLGRVGSVIDPAKDVVTGGNRHMFTLNTGMLVIAGDGSWGVGICPLDSPTVSLEEPGCWKYSLDFVPTKSRVFVNLCNNQWSTNFRLWNGGTWTSRVRLWMLGKATLESGLITPSLETRYPLESAMADGPAGKLPLTRTGVEVSRKGVMVTAFGDNPDGKGTLLRLWELAGQGGPVTVKLPEGLTGNIREVDLRGRPIGGPIQPKNGQIELDLKAFGVKSVVVTP